MLLLDSSGTVLKDTMYSNHYYPGAYIGGGNIFSDKNGGYFHWGNKDSTPTPYPQSIDWNGNYPSYLAHLDTNFIMDWRCSYPNINIKGYSSIAGIYQCIQTKDSGYLAMGYREGVAVNGWLCKLNKFGKVIWDHIYFKDSTQEGYIAEAKERPNGGFVCVGWTKACPKCTQDIWLLSIDSNGCELPICNIGLSVYGNPAQEAEFSLFPNPNNGRFTVNCPEPGVISIWNLQAQQLHSIPIHSGKSSLELPGSITPGIYLCKYQSSTSGKGKTLRLLFQP